MQHFGLRGLEDMPSLQPEEAVALEALAAQGQAIAVDLAMPTAQVEGEAAAPPPARPAALIEAQLSLLADEAPLAEHAGAVAEEVGATTMPEVLTAEMPETDRANDGGVVMDVALDQPEASIEPQSSEEIASNENAAS